MMALGNFFEKIALGASQILNNYNPTTFKCILASKTIGVAFDWNAIQAFEGRALLDMLVRIIARLYSGIRFIGPSDEVIQQLQQLALSINPEIDFPNQESIVVVVGECSYTSNVPQLFVGSSNWNAHFSTSRAISCGNSKNPIGAGAAACLAAANVFRKVFEDYLPDGAIDQDFSFSTFDYSLPASPLAPPLPTVTLNNIALIGTGAIGNAVLWALKWGSVGGQLHIIDDDVITLSNLQRYILSEQDHIGKRKVEVFQKMFSSSLIIHAHPYKWQNFLQNIGFSEIKTAVVAIDTAHDRRVIQASLPLKIFNAWTSADNIGVSRHLDFTTEPCLCCLYLPREEKPSFSQMVAESLGMLDLEETQVRPYLANNRPVDKAFLSIIAKRNKLTPEQISDYEGKPLEVFYSEAICGGRILNLAGATRAPQAAEVPMAHESALAGILLAAELIIDNLGGRIQKISPLSKLNLLRPLTPYILEPEGKHSSGKCICQDSVFANYYRQKWNI